MLFPSSKQVIVCTPPGFKLDQEGIYVKGQSCFSRSMKSLASTEKVPGVSGGFWNVFVFNVCFQEFPIPSMYGIFTYICLIFMVNVGRYTIHGCYEF